MHFSFSLFFFTDACGVQVRAHSQAYFEGEARHAAAVRAQAAQDADQVPRPAVEEVKHEDNVGHLHQSQAQA